MTKIWTKYLRGTVRIKVKGEDSERFLNYCLKNNIQIWEVSRTDHLVLHMYTDDALKIRVPLRNMGCTFKVIHRKGAPSLVRKMISRSGFVIGLFIFFIIVFLMSNTVWNIEIRGADPKTEHHLQKVIDEMGIQKGKLIFRLPDPREIQYLATEKMDEVTWIGVTLEGTTFHFNVVQKELPEEVETVEPRNLVAKKRAFITTTYVEQGQIKVEKNQLVHKGDLLVSGQIGKDKHMRTVAAKGKVFGETWYRSDVSVPLKSSFETYTGNKKVRHYVSIFGMNVPIWGFGKIEYKHFEEIEDVNTFRMFNWEIPLSYVKKDVLESERVIREYTAEKAVSMAKQMADEEMESYLDEEATIKSGKILHHTIDNGKVNVSMYYKVIENIVEEQPIIGGD
ncbi:sporulation protein YqfD [Pseudalkalibacillus berkeleyi]|uniref:Sporulation protein YqfD n=1 Tax=Pseudalkalibacillus berkeleyi TaxID=1069813 RepID=A0ABS9GYX4_9BACL|nr:sporulation protein YqfD [Pseudalkalibacillus berkeleyi]MCF6137967.1 sporulation protein YqfD [Pseudalkalibacillus berkeleyi]